MKTKLPDYTAGLFITGMTLGRSVIDCALLCVIKHYFTLLHTI